MAFIILYYNCLFLPNHAILEGLHLIDFKSLTYCRLKELLNEGKNHVKLSLKANTGEQIDGE